MINEIFFFFSKYAAGYNKIGTGKGLSGFGHP
jgi:hypothetical protein